LPILSPAPWTGEAAKVQEAAYRAQDLGGAELDRVQRAALVLADVDRNKTRLAMQRITSPARPLAALDFFLPKA
jgi:hypothetical protein